VDIADCLVDNQPNVVVLSGVLNYLEHPYTVLDQLLTLLCDHVIIDRTLFWGGPTDRLCVQSVPPSIYKASYPSWIFSTTRFRYHLDKEWEIVEEFESIDRLKAPIKIECRGLLLVRRNHHVERDPQGSQD